MIMRGSYGIKDWTMPVSCPTCLGAVDVPIIELERVKEIVCPHCGRRFPVDPGKK